MLKKYSRKNYIINPKFQLNIVMWCFVLFFSILFIFASANWFFFSELASLATSAGIKEGNIFFEFLADQKLIMLRFFLVSSLFALLAIFVGGIYLSHRISGPIHQFIVHLTKTEGIPLEKIEFRKNDYFQELKDAYNNFVEKINKLPKK